MLNKSNQKRKWHSPVQVKPAKTSQSTRSVALNLQRTKGPRSKGILVFLYRLSLKGQGAEKKHQYTGLFNVRRESSVVRKALFTTPKSFPQHISSLRIVAISILVVRPRCSEQRITGVVIHCWLPSAAGLSTVVFCISPQPLSVQNSPSLTEPRREAVSAASCLLCSLRAK